MTGHSTPAENGRKRNSGQAALPTNTRDPYHQLAEPDPTGSPQGWQVQGPAGWRAATPEEERQLRRDALLAQLPPWLRALVDPRARVSAGAAGSPPAPMRGSSEGNPMPEDPVAPSGPVVGCLAVRHNRVDCLHLPHSQRCPVCRRHA